MDRRCRQLRKVSPSATTPANRYSTPKPTKMRTSGLARSLRSNIRPIAIPPCIYPILRFTTNLVSKCATRVPTT
ncbi:unnamed protein product, partial [Nesidiocoris tenuis]